MKVIRQIGVVFALTVTPVTAINAQQQSVNFLPLEQLVQDGAETSVLALRCAGLFHSVWDFIGEAMLGVKATNQAKSNVTLFLDAGTKALAAETSQPEQDVSKAAVAEAFAVSSKYYAHYETNVAAGRDAYASDEMWNSDLEICKNLSAQL